MVPFITKNGRCFSRAISYFCFDKGATTTERISWIEMRNLITDDPAVARRIMDFTFRNRERLKQAAGYGIGGRTVEEPVFSYSLSWHPEEQPTKQEMVDVVDETLGVLGLAEHEAIIVSHDDEPHSHVHLVINRIHPLRGIAANLSHSKRKLSDFALNYERSKGKIYCSQREKNFRRRQNGTNTRYQHPVILDAWNQSTDGEEFVSALLKHGYHIADGGKRLVVIGPYGNILNPVRHLQGVRAREFKEAMMMSYPEGFPSIRAVKQKLKIEGNSQQPVELREE